MDLEYMQAVDVLGQLRVGDSISDALRSEAQCVTREIFDKYRDRCDVESIEGLLFDNEVSTQLRNTWTDAICDVWLN
ncbi:hypothetical protein RN22_08845 [Grimontia sp. AD028]|nr:MULTISPECIES: hypothetical protein [Grimontia]KKD60839.1 hypothetical protein RN22_08845 [Grimontia sp. AD028]